MGTLIVTLIIVLIAFRLWDKTYERQEDTCNLDVIFWTCIAVAFLSTHNPKMGHIAWASSAFSQVAAVFAIVPQYIFCYRNQGAQDIGVTLFVGSMGGARVFFACDWLFNFYYIFLFTGYVWHVHLWICHMVEIIFFIDYMMFKMIDKSLLRDMVLKVDSKINDVEMFKKRDTSLMRDMVLKVDSKINDVEGRLAVKL